jgi:hypothetical protein
LLLGLQLQNHLGAPIILNGHCWAHVGGIFMDEGCHPNTLVNFSRVLSLDSFQIFSFCLPAYWSQERPLNYCKGLKTDLSLMLKRLSPLERRSGHCVSPKTLEDKSSLSLETTEQHFAKKVPVVWAHSFWASTVVSRLSTQLEPVRFVRT